MTWPMTAKIFPVILISCWLVAGCGTSRAAYEKPGVAEVDRKRDEAECAKASIGGVGARRGFELYRIDREAYRQCMEGRGYTLRS